ncbi:uncharacterized protein ACNS7B_001018 isoform 2-T3 [Menidia menidia]
MEDFRHCEQDFYQSGYYVDDQGTYYPPQSLETEGFQDVTPLDPFMEQPPPGFPPPPSEALEEEEPPLLEGNQLFRAGGGLRPRVAEDADGAEPAAPGGRRHHERGRHGGAPAVLRGSGPHADDGREGPVRPGVRAERQRLLGDVRAAQPHELGGRVLRLRVQRAGILSAAHRGPGRARRPPLAAVSPHTSFWQNS